MLPKCNEKMSPKMMKKKGFLNGDVTPQLVTLQTLMLIKVLGYNYY